MKIIFEDADNDIREEIEIPNSDLQSQDNLSKITLKIARAFVAAVAKQGFLVPLDAKEKSE